MYGEDIYSVYVWRTITYILFTIIPMLIGLIGWLWQKVDKKIDNISDKIDQCAKYEDIVQRIEEMYNILQQSNISKEDLGRAFDNLAVLKDMLDSLYHQCQYKIMKNKTD